MITQCLIVYESGCYGTFVEWLLNFFIDPTLDVPFTDSGNSHKFIGNFLDPKPKLFQYLASSRQSRFSRIHPGGIFSNDISRLVEVYNEEIEFLKKHFQKVLVLNYSQESVLWHADNTLDKIFISDFAYEKMLKPYGVDKELIKPLTTKDPILRFKHILDAETKDINSTFTKKNLLGWNKNSIYDFEIWELRELLSFYWFTRSDGLIDCWNTIQQMNPDVLFISIDELEKNFFGVIEKITTHFDLKKVSNLSLEKLPQVHQQWLSLQKHINKDLICSKIVDSICNDLYLDWSDVELSIIDEAWIQKSLRDHGILIKCDNLIKFPSDTKSFNPYLEFTKQQ